MNFATPERTPTKASAQKSYPGHNSINFPSEYGKNAGGKSKIDSINKVSRRNIT